ncbi:MAG: hypothetical protein JW801_00190 [Bacteroidales bacterium]|nr:hypothetical protein [Bacteroidales bacterium]
MKFIYTGLLLTLFFPFRLDAQFFSSGQDPAHIQWRQINTDNFQLIYPEEFQPEALRVANTLEYLYEHESADYSVKPRKISIILHNHSVVSNGYVSWAPRRSEWVATPPSESEPLDWLQLLAVHEFRHVIQVSNLDQGFTRICKVLFGEAAVGLTVGYLPLWFLEGDAVLAETAYSSSGRGRESEFDREIRAIELDSGKRYSYDQSYLGSYKHYTPSHYNYGYQMVSYANIKYKSNIWDQVLRQVSRTPFLGVPFYLGLKKAGVTSKSHLYHQTFDSLKIFWNNMIDTSISTITSNITIYPDEEYREFLHPEKTEGGYLVVRKSLDDITRFVFLTPEGEELIHSPGYYPNTRWCVGKQYICWEEYRYDPRWDQQSFGTLAVMDRSNGNIRKFGKRERWFSPDLSPDEQKLACLQVDLANRYSLIILDIETGEVQLNIGLPDLGKAEAPIWMDDKHIALIVAGISGESIQRINLETGKREDLFKGGNHNIGYLEMAGNQLLFTFDNQMARNIYAYNLQDQLTYRLTNSRHGVDFPSYHPGTDVLLFSEYTKMGYRPVSLPIDSLDPVPLSDIESFTYPWAESLSGDKSINIQEDNIPECRYEVKPYRKFLHGLNIHSWAPFYINPYEVSDLATAIYPGLTLMSQNKLSTVTALLSYYYTENAHQVESRIIYEGLYPVFEARFNLSSEPRFHSWPQDTALPATPEFDKRVNVLSYIPLSFNRNSWNLYLKPQLGFTYFHRYYYAGGQEQLGYNSLEGSIYAFAYTKESYRDLQPRLGESLYLSFLQPLKSPDFFSSVFTGIYNQYLPGIFKHHGIRLGLYYEKQDPGKYPIYWNQVSLPRGYSAPAFYKRNKKAVFEYSFPLGYPDWSLGPLVYIKRIHLSFHADFARVDFIDSGNLLTQNMFSTGIILGSDLHFFRFFMPFEPRFRVTYLPFEKKFDFGFSMNLNTSVY